MTTITPQVVYKAPGDIFPVTFDFSHLLETGEKLSSATVTVQPFFGVDPNPNDVLDSSAQVESVAGKSVIQRIKGGLADHIYRLTCTAVTDADPENTFVLYGMLEVD